MAGMQHIKYALFSMIIFLVGCSDPYKEKVNQQTPITELRVKQLADALKSGQVRNASVIKQYASKLRQQKPELTQLINEFKMQGKLEDTIYC